MRALAKWIAGLGALAVFVYFLYERVSGNLRYERVGPRPSAGQKTLVLLHGYGATGDDLTPLAGSIESASPGLTVLVPTAPHTVNLTGRAWVPNLQASTQGELSTLLLHEVEETTKRVWHLIDYARSKGVDCRDIYVGGFSQGGRIAIDVALRGPADCALGGAIIFSGGGLQEVALPSPGGVAPLRVLVSHGRSDGVLSAGQGLAIAQHFVKGGHDVRWFAFDGSHEIPPQVVTAAVSFLRGETVGAEVPGT